jgi:hypothetical protein
MNASPGAVSPARRLRRRYAHAPAVAVISVSRGLRPPGRQDQGERRGAYA